MAYINNVMFVNYEKLVNNVDYEYQFTKIWNLNESRAQVNKNGLEKVLAKKKSKKILVCNL